MATARILRVLPVLVFLTLIVLPSALLTVTGPWPGRSAPDFRPLRSLPSSLTSSTFRRISDWFSDRTGLRWPLLWAGVEITDKVWQPRVRGNAIFGRDPWLFWTDDQTSAPSIMADFRGRLRLPDRDVTTIDNTFRAARAAYEACGKRIFVVIAPNKQSIYPEEMGRKGGDRPTRLDHLLEALSPPARAIMIDPRSAMRAAKPAHAAPLYYHTDSHWNDLGAYYTYRAVVEALSKENTIYAPELAAIENYELAIEPIPGGDIAMRILSLPYRFPDVRPSLRWKQASAQLEQTVFWDRYVYRNPDGRGRLLMNGDSFSGPLAGFLARHFAELTVLLVNGWLAPFDGAAIRELNADVVLVEKAERSLPILAMPARHLTAVCAN